MATVSNRKCCLLRFYSEQQSPANRSGSPKNGERVIGLIDRITNQTLDLDMRFDRNQLNHMPETGPAIVVSNHPTGVLDAFVVLYYLGNFRPDAYVLINELFIDFFPHFSEQLLPIDIFSKGTIPAMRAIAKVLKNQGYVLMFPATKIARPSPIRVKESPWNDGFLKLAEWYQVPVVPIKLKAKNSWVFNLAAKISGPLALMQQFREIAHAAGRTYAMDIAKPIRPSNLKQAKEILGEFYGKDFTWDRNRAKA